MRSALNSFETILIGPIDWLKIFASPSAADLRFLALQIGAQVSISGSQM